MNSITHTMTRRRALQGLGGASAFALLPACATTYQASESAAATPASEVEALLQSIADNLLAFSPGAATALGIDTGERADMRSRLSDVSPAGIAQLQASVQADFERASAAEQTGLPDDLRISLEVVKSAYRTALDGFAFPYGEVTVGGWRNTPYVVSQITGAYIDLPRFLGSAHPLNNANDAEAYLARMEQFADVLDGETARMREAADFGVTPPDFLIDKALPQMRSVLTNLTSPDSTILATLEERTANIPGDWSGRALAISSTSVAAAMQRQIAEMERQRGLAASAPGMSQRPLGDDFYRWLLRASTTTTLSPAEIHELGKQRLEELYAEMNTILRSIGYTGGTVGQRMKALGEDPKYLFPNNDEGRTQLLAYLDERLEIIRAEMPRAFETLAPGNVEIHRIPVEEQDGAAGAYAGAGSIDGSIPGKFWINLNTTERHPRFRLPTLLHHEAIPGHIWQGEYSNQLPLVRTLLGFGAYGEGWALYAEQLADELGVYDAEPVLKLGYLQQIAFRACRLVVDTGLHAFGWGREQAVQWFHETNGSPLVQVRPEIDRYCAWPGQACSYEVGHIEINRQRDRAQAELGAAYDFKAFNNAVVAGGEVPLDVLEQQIDRYIANARR